MREFTYTVTDSEGLHTRRAGLLAMRARAFRGTDITVSADGNTVKTSQLMKLIGLGIKRGSRVTVAAEGPQENDAISIVRSFFEYYL